ncbi:hypothetical protein J1605_004791 [Eschrichtius robustus]|uniref:Uncharacterized protein n=1 Tax=Eschrichtius robustus TaxID=9764 RepID=A0AB34HHJ4_ESCRO|nr:hypothetical protein J1605_004791 [Eschrichtius robustus]
MVLLPSGGQAQYVTVPGGLLMPIPAGLTMPQAAAIPEAWLTAFQLSYLLDAVRSAEATFSFLCCFVKEEVGKWSSHARRSSRVVISPSSQMGVKSVSPNHHGSQSLL